MNEYIKKIAPVNPGIQIKYKSVTGLPRSLAYTEQHKTLGVWGARAQTTSTASTALFLTKTLKCIVDSL